MKSWHTDKKAKVVQFYFETKSATLTHNGSYANISSPGKRHLETSLADCRQVSDSEDCSQKLQATQQPQAQPKDFCVRPSRKRCTSAKTTQVDAPTRSGSGCSRDTVHMMASVDTRILPYNSSIPLHYSSANGSSTTVPLLTPLEDTRDWPLEHFGQRVMSRLESCPWPASSQDFTPPDFFSQGYLRSKVYWNNPRSLEDLKDAVRSAVRRLSPSVCALQQRTRCAEQNGSNLEHVSGFPK